MSNINFTEEEKKEVWDIILEYTNLNSLASSLKLEILVDKESVSEMMDKLQKDDFNEDDVFLNERLANIIQNHQDHTQALNLIIEEIEAVKANEQNLYQRLATKYDVEISTIITELTSSILA